MKPLNELTALEALAKIEDGSLTAEALTEACLERIALREDVVGAWHFIDPDHARAAARAVDQSTTGWRTSRPSHCGQGPVRHRRHADRLRLAHLRRVVARRRMPPPSPCREPPGASSWERR